MYTVFYALPLVLGFDVMDEKQHLSIPLMDELLFTVCSSLYEYDFQCP